MRKRIILVAIVLIGAGAAQGKSGKSYDANKVLKKAELVRNPAGDYSATVILKDNNNGKKDERTFYTKIKSPSKALVEFKTPVSEAGKKVLMDDNNMWIYMPKTAKPIRISPRQKMAGNASYGDIARLQFVGNYKPQFVKTAKLKGKSAIVLKLTAIAGRAVTYSTIEYWVDEKSYMPLKTVYMTPNGKALKIGYFEKRKRILGKLRPTVLRLLDQVNKKHVTILTFKNTKKQNFPAMVFKKQSLNRS